MFEVIYPLFGFSGYYFFSNAGFSGYKMKEVNLLPVATEHNAYVEISYRRHVHIR